MNAIIKMKEHITDWAAFALAIIFSLVYWAGIPSVPFHPDESTQIFMSSDVALFFQQPGGLAWRPGASSDPRQQLRLLDAPLTRDLIGLGRIITVSPGLPADWSWSLSWDANAAAGALPSDALLRTARYSVAWLFPFSLVFMYLSARKVANRGVGIIALLLLAGNALALLHTRRAMAESALLFTVILSFWCLVSFQKRPWLTALPIALAFAAKQTAVGLFFVGLIVIMLREWPASKKQMAKNLVLYLVLFLAITFMLNPFLWADPLGAVNAAITARQDLLQRQVADYSRLMPQMVLATLPERMLGIGSHLYFLPLQFAESANYLVETQASISAYLSVPFQNLVRGFIGGGIIIFLSLAGFVQAVVNYRKQSPAFKINMGLLILSTLAISISLVASLPLAFQRYVIPAVPFSVLWAAYGVEQVIWRPALQFYQRFRIPKMKHTTLT